jgi:glucitol operon activator protein
MRPIHAGLLLAAFALMIATNWAQQLYYLRTVNRLAGSERRPGRMLVSGRSAGRLRGAVALLVVRQEDDVIERALVMEGTTVFARFRERPDCHGPVDAAPAAEASKAARAAVRSAVEHYRRLKRGEAPQPAGRASAAGDFVQRYRRLTGGKPPARPDRPRG